MGTNTSNDLTAVDHVTVDHAASGSRTVAIPATMRAVVARRYGTPDVLTVDDIPVPVPADNEVLIEVGASSLNALDWHFLTGTPYLIRATSGLRRPKRLTPGADIAGTVAALGGKVTGFEVGDEVFGECPGGGCGHYMTAAATHVVRKPASVAVEAAAATPVAGLTALQGLRTHAAVQPGDHVLINGAAGGVGTYAVQIAKALGAEVTAVCSTRNVDMVKAIGADMVIDYTADDFVAGGARFDVMLDNVGNRTPAECLSVLKPQARFVIVSGPKRNRWLGPVPHIARSALAFRRASQSFHQFTAAPNADDLNFLGELLETAQLVPQIDRVIDLDGVAAGMAEIGTGHAKAKMVVVP